MQSLAIIDQLITILCTACDLANYPVKEGCADGSQIHVEEEIAKGSIRRRTLELSGELLVQHAAVAPNKALHIVQAFELVRIPSTAISIGYKAAL